MQTLRESRGEPIGVPDVQGAFFFQSKTIMARAAAHHVGVTTAVCPEVSQLAAADSSLPFHCYFQAQVSHHDISGSMQFQ